MKKSIILLALVMVAFSCRHEEKTISIIPQPSSIIKHDGSFVIDPTVVVLTEKDNKEAHTIAKLFIEQFSKSSGMQLNCIDDSLKSTGKIIHLVRADMQPEAYSLSVTKKIITIKAGSEAGWFYGIQTLMQLAPPEIFSQTKTSPKLWDIPCVEINDAPRFAYRGHMLDVCRHIFPVSFLKKYIDLMAMHKINRFHWHLTDDQGWRIEIKKYPKLTEVGSIRKKTLKGRYQKPFVYDETPYGGFYTQDEIREVVAYAAERYITVIPEIEMPGHATAALTAYPELGCTGGPYEVWGLWGVNDEVFCAGNDKVFELLEGVLEEVIELFPSELIHIGGDECPKVRWEKCKKCQARIRKEHLKNEHELQSYFIRRIEKFVNSKGRRIIGFDEILEGGLAPNATVMSWRGNDGGVAAAKSGHDAVMVPTSHLYIDYYQGDPATEPLAIGGYVPIQRVYSYEPVPEVLTAEEAKHIIGTQANLWTEYIPEPEKVEYMAYPRLCALSEIAWSAKENKEWVDFANRLVFHLNRLNYRNVNYARNIFDVEASMTGAKDSVCITLGSPIHNTEIRYTLDVENPSPEWKHYEQPIKITEPTKIKAGVYKNRELMGKVTEHTFDPAKIDKKKK